MSLGEVFEEVGQCPAKAVDDLKALLRKFQIIHGRPVAGPGRQRRYAPLAISDGWLLSAAPHYAFSKATEAERQVAAAAEVERQALLAMPYHHHRRRLAGHSRSSQSLRHEPPDKPTPISPSMRRTLNAILRTITNEEDSFT
jgi:hypothetical protein